MHKSFARTLASSLLAVCGSWVVLGCIAGQSPAERVDGSDWPVFLGPTGDGKSSETGILKHWNEDGPPLLWQMPVGEGYAAPSVADGRLFLFDRHRDTVRLTCIDAGTGDELWRSEYATDYEDMYGYSNGPRAVPVVDGDLVYTFGPAGRLRSHRVDDGSLVWQVDTAATFGVIQNFFGASSVPVVEGDLLIAAIGGSPEDSPGIQSGKVVGNGSGIVAFDKRTGEVRYRITDELASYSSPRIVTIGERRWGFFFARGGRCFGIRCVDDRNDVVLTQRDVRIDERHAMLGHSLLGLTDQLFQIRHIRGTFVRQAC